MFRAPEALRWTDAPAPYASTAADGNNGVFRLGPLRILCSDGMGWEHVSVSLSNRCPTWKEMCTVKAQFWGREDCVIQYHPPEPEYVNYHPFTLHLWREIGREFSLPPSLMVGPKGLKPAAKP
jgi:hypothetical protein